MSEEYGNNIVSLTDEDGNECEFEHIDTLEMDGVTYLALIPAEMVAEDEAEVVILKIEEDENGEEMLVSLDDEVLLMNLYNAFMERLEDMYEIGEDE